MIKIKKLSKSLLLMICTLNCLSVIAQQKISGRVLNATSKAPVIGATVTVKGTNQATSSDDEGRFSLMLSEGRRTIIVSNVGFETQELIAGPDLSIQLKESTSDLNAVIVTGYSSQRKKDITGAVSVVKMGDLLSIPAVSTENQLQGRAAGVTIINNNQPGSVSTVRIRGFSSFTGNNPLYIIDGVPTDSLIGLNPDDVESMQVLKDAASASVYGSRASNGVIILTTKKGKPGPARLSYNTYYGIQDPGKGVKNLIKDPMEYAQLQRLAFKNSNEGPSSIQYGSGAEPVIPDYILAGNQSGLFEGDPAVNSSLYDLDYAKLGDPNYIPYLIVRANKQGTDWWKELTRNAPITNHTLTVSGGSPDKSRYLASVNYFQQDGIVITNFFKRYSARFNSEFNIKNNIRIGENIQILFSEGNQAINNSETGEIEAAIDMLSIVPAYTINGHDFAGSKGNELGNTTNPVALRIRKQYDRGYNTNIFGNVYAEVDFLKHFTARTSFGGTYATNDSKVYPTLEYEGSENHRNTSFLRLFGKKQAWTWTNQVSYRNTFGLHSVQALAGTEAIEEKGEQMMGSRSGFFSYTNYGFISLNTGIGNQLVSGIPTNQAATFSVFGKVDYDYNNRYLAGVTIRRDGSSKFGASTRYGVFPAASVGWRISEENFMKGVKWIADLKLRGSFGSMGNQRIPSANQFTQFTGGNSASSYDIYGTNTNPASGFYLSFIGNTKGQWETNTTSNIGIDASLFKGTEITFDIYQKKTKNLLFPVEQLATAGGIASINPPFFNIGSMKNWGIDFAVSQRANVGALKIDATLTLTTYKNTITKIADGIEFFDYNSPLNESNRLNGVFTRNAVGHSINSYYGYDVIGYFQSAADVSASAKQQDAAPGRFKYRDADNNKVIDENDRVFFGNPNPNYTAGLNINLSYRNFDLSTFFYNVMGRDAINYLRFTTDFYSATNKSRDALYNSWTPERHNARLPIQETATTFSTNAIPNSYYKENASYLRMKNLSIGYNIPSKLLNRFSIDRLKLYLQATNLFTITKYTGLDPEIFSTDDRAAGIDLGVYPAVKQYIIGLSLNF